MFEAKYLKDPANPNMDYNFLVFDGMTSDFVENVLA